MEKSCDCRSLLLLHYDWMSSSIKRALMRLFSVKHLSTGKTDRDVEISGILKSLRMLMLLLSALILVMILSEPAVSSLLPDIRFRGELGCWRSRTCERYVIGYSGYVSTGESKSFNFFTRLAILTESWTWCFFEAVCAIYGFLLDTTRWLA